MPNDFSNFEELLREALGIRFTKVSHTVHSYTVNRKDPEGQMIRKTAVSSIIRTGHVIKNYYPKGVRHDA